MQRKGWIVALIAMAGIASCGDTYLERGTSGALIGAGAAAATDNNPLTGAAIGGGAGVLTTN